MERINIKEFMSKLISMYIRKEQKMDKKEQKKSSPPCGREPNDL